MTKLELIVKGTSEKIKATYRSKKIFKALEAAELNAQEDLDVAKDNLDNYVNLDNSEKDGEKVVSELADLVSSKKDAEYTLEVLKEVRSYLEAEVTAE